MSSNCKAEVNEKRAQQSMRDVEDLGHRDGKEDRPENQPKDRMWWLVRQGGEMKENGCCGHINNNAVDWVKAARNQASTGQGKMEGRNNLLLGVLNLNC